MKKHTFVIPAYNASPFLEDCIQHLLKVRTATSSIIITTSTPSVYLEQIAQKYHLPYYINPDKTGMANDWNFALSKADTPLVTLAHQDDIYESGYAEAIIKHMDDDTLIAFTNYTDIVNNKARTGGTNAWIKNLLLFPFLFTRKISSRFNKLALLRFGDPICCPSVTFNKAALGHFRFDENYTCALDWLAWYQLAQREGNFVYIKQKLVRHRIHPGSETVNQITQGIRKKEEQQLFELMWGKRVAKLLSGIYALGHKDNL